MTRYCLVTGTEVPANLTVHRLDCHGYDLATVLSEGRIVNLGKFDNSLMALFAIKSVHPVAAACPECCDPDLKPPQASCAGSLVSLHTCRAVPEPGRLSP